ncbi:hypothetical protein B0H19DRAFT_1226899 [Mycena capillaripes]|nr:hypothetical protein B0H19DRAFT_1226899 [Mycena capillaripes]
MRRRKMKESLCEEGHIRISERCGKHPSRGSTYSTRYTKRIVGAIAMRRGRRTRSCGRSHAQTIRETNTRKGHEVDEEYKRSSVHCPLRIRLKLPWVTCRETHVYLADRAKNTGHVERIAHTTPKRCEARPRRHLHGRKGDEASKREEDEGPGRCLFAERGESAESGFANIARVRNTMAAERRVGGGVIRSQARYQNRKEAGLHAIRGACAPVHACHPRNGRPNAVVGLSSHL